MKKTAFILIIIFGGIIYPQNENQNKKLSLSFTGGTSLNCPITHYFYGERKDRLINPGIYGSAGAEYGPLKIAELTELSFSLTAGYTKVSTTRYHLEPFPSDAQLIIETFPILIWSKLQTNTVLSPFIEMGVGISRLNFIERYSNWLNGTSFNYWALGYGFGAGLNYKISPTYEIALVAQSLTNEKNNMVENDRDHLTGINVRNTVVVVGLRFTIKLQ